MGILPMRRRVILALQLVFFLQTDSLVKRTARMAVPLVIHFPRDLVAGFGCSEHKGRQWLRIARE